MKSDRHTIPTVTTSQRDAGSFSAAVGDIIYNSTIGSLQQYTAQGWVSVASIPTITGIKYSNQTSGTFAENSGQTATDPAGGDLVQLTGTNFDSTAAGFPNNVAISIGGTAATNISVNSAKTEVTFTAPAKSAGSYTLTATNATGINATTTIVYDSVPSWTATGALGNFVIGDSFTNSSAVTIRVQASEGSDTITYRQTDSSGSTITSAIAGLTLGTTGANAGYLTGTLGGTDGQTHNFYAVATDAEKQDTNSAPTLFNIITRTYPAGGGAIETGQSGYAVHVFGESGTLPSLDSSTVTTFTVYKTITGADILIVGGGGGGGAGGTGNNVGAGGGGAGGMRVLTNETLNAGTYNVTVGGGGTGGESDVNISTQTFNVANARSGRKGVTSSIIQQTGTGSYSYSAEGGGHGDYQMAGHLYNTVQASQSGGSGGGASQLNPNHGTGVGTGSNGNAEGYYGSDGGDANGNEGGGGGGAGQAGQTGPGNGGNGLQNNFRTGSNVYYAGGGGGARYSGAGTNGSGGNGGGGSAVGSGTPGHGTNGLGGGGGGTVNQSNVDGGNGGSGIVIIRYAI